jgi:hypothetical protein
VAERDAKRRVDVERLRFLDEARRACGRVAHVRDADVAGQDCACSRAEDLAHHAVAFPHREARAVAGGNARRVLTAVLQQLQRVVQQLVDRSGGHNADDAAHEFLLNAPSARAGGQDRALGNHGEANPTPACSHGSSNDSSHQTSRGASVARPSRPAGRRPAVHAQPRSLRRARGRQPTAALRRARPAKLRRSVPRRATSRPRL